MKYVGGHWMDRNKQTNIPKTMTPYFWMRTCYIWMNRFWPTPNTLPWLILSNPLPIALTLLVRKPCATGRLSPPRQFLSPICIAHYWIFFQNTRREWHRTLLVKLVLAIFLLAYPMQSNFFTPFQNTGRIMRSNKTKAIHFDFCHRLACATTTNTCLRMVEMKLTAVGCSAGPGCTKNIFYN